MRVGYARGDKPVGVYCDPLRYEELHERIVGPEEGGNEMYRGYYLAIDTDVLNNSCKLVEGG